MTAVTDYVAALTVRDCAAVAVGLSLGLAVMLAALAVVPRRVEVLVRREDGDGR